jgi:hypothetical protein
VEQHSEDAVGLSYLVFIQIDVQPLRPAAFFASAPDSGQSMTLK